MNDSANIQTAFDGVISYINAAVTNIRLYASDHPQVRRQLERAHGALTQLLRLKPEITIIIIGDDMVVDQQPLTARTPSTTQFIRHLNRCAVERISFMKGVSLVELTQLAGDLAGSEKTAVRSTAAIKLGKVQVRGQTASPERRTITPEMQARIEKLGSARDLSLDRLRDLYDRIKAFKQTAVSGFEEIVQSFIKGMIGNVHPLHVLASLKTSDEYTFTHAINVCILTMAQAEALGISGRQLYDIGIAASLHDAGKVFVPDEILNKPGKLSDDEWVLMRNHTIRGARQILKMEGIPRVAFIAALEHHIRYDGTGYPQLKNWRPSLVSQMVAIADMFDAMRSRRPYQEPKPDELILGILRKDRGTAFHPILVDNFLRIVDQ